MATNFYYIDDDPLSTITETARGLSVRGELLIIPNQHLDWETEINFLIKNQDQYDGLLFDWGLTRKNEADVKANFNVEALAQQLRRLIVEKVKIKKDFPIILCSAKYKFKQIFTKEISSHDLFDAVYEKDEFNDNRKKVVSELMDLSDSYKYLNDNINNKAAEKSALAILGQNELTELDYRLSDSLIKLIKESKPNHEIARFLLSDVIKFNGLLINEHLLAARLGVDIMQSAPDKNWGKLVKELDSLKYKGVFGVAWERWWMNKLLAWWEATFHCSLGSLSGPQRVEMLNKKFKLKLIPAEKTDKSRSDFFWFICKESNKPIALEDAIMTISPAKKASWEEDEYLSIDKALEHDMSTINSLEKDRLQRLKKMYTKIRS